MDSLANYIVEAPSIKTFGRTIDKHWKDQDIVYNYESALSLGHSDRARIDISPDSSDNDLYVQV